MVPVAWTEESRISARLVVPESTWAKAPAAEFSVMALPMAAPTPIRRTSSADTVTLSKALIVLLRMPASAAFNGLPSASTPSPAIARVKAIPAPALPPANRAPPPTPMSVRW